MRINGIGEDSARKSAWCQGRAHEAESLCVLDNLHPLLGEVQRHAELAGIAAELGYADHAHFTRDFRLATGLTPGEFAARFR